MRKAIEALFAAGAAAGLLLAATAASSASRGAWKTVKVTDPITGASSCTVTAADSVGKSFSFTRTGFLYPVVENSSAYGLLVGVSSGGAYRLPTGTIVWRVDENPFRRLDPTDNPVNSAVAPATSVGAPTVNSDPVVAKAIADTLALTSKLAAGGATSTMASGEKAKVMLAEMLAGKSLLFRAEAAAPAFGLPTGGTYAVGQLTRDGKKPILIDDSFRAGLKDCGIAIP